MPINAEPEGCEDHQDQDSVLPRKISSYSRCVLQKEDGKEIWIVYTSLEARRSKSLKLHMQLATLTTILLSKKQINDNGKFMLLSCLTYRDFSKPVQHSSYG